MKHIAEYKRGDHSVREHLRNGIAVEHETHGRGLVCRADWESESLMVWFSCPSKGLMKVGRRALSLVE